MAKLRRCWTGVNGQVRLSPPAATGTYSAAMNKTFRFSMWCTGLALLANQAIAAGVPAYRVTAPNGVSSVLLGTMHIPFEGMRQPADQVLQRARHFVVEQVGAADNGRRLMKPAAATVVVDGQERADWARSLTAAQLTMLLERLQCNVKGPVAPTKMRESLEFMLTRQSAMLAENAAIRPCAPPGLKSRDQLMLEAAATVGLVPEPLESASAVAAQRDLVPEAHWRHSLSIALSAEAPAKLRVVVDAFNHGDLDVLRDLFLQAPASAGAAEHWEVMVDQRNHAWMPKLRHLLDDGPSFVLVGGAHLAGPGGLPELLKAAGYRLDRIELPARP